MRQRIIHIRTIIFIIFGSVLALSPCKAQLAVDVSLNANYLEESDIWGGGAALHFAFAGYAFELVPSGAYYVASEDTTETWSVGLDGRANLFSIGFLRPYIGVGFVRMTQSDIKKTILNFTGGGFIFASGTTERFLLLRPDTEPPTLSIPGDFGLE